MAVDFGLVGRPDKPQEDYISDKRIATVVRVCRLA